MKKTLMKKHLTALTVCLIIFAFCLPTYVFAAFKYEHDPMENPKAAEDIIENPDAVYGYSPNPDSVRLGEYANALDWTDEAQVADARAKRIEYHAQNAELYQMIDTMKAEEKDIEEIARAVSKRRNEFRLESYEGDPKGLEIVKKSNMDTYGNEEGPTADSLYEKYGSWEKVLDKALSSNPGMDACLGLYDEMYYTYDIAVSGTDTQANAPQTTSPATGDTGSRMVLLTSLIVIFAGIAAILLLQSPAEEETNKTL